ncbi:MAG: low specificity L-threonine aldolase [Thermodesulfobacteriota bacterium]|nr:low specificity L-threonine aldolase [Thermodesulfobacteriota bacterium]
MMTSLPDQQLASDNYPGICPEALEYLMKVNAGHEPPYGDDRWTKEACEMFRDIFGTACEVFFVFNGTAANALSLASLCQSYHSIICHKLAHVETDECGAPEFFSHGTKLLMVEGENGKINPQSIETTVTRRSDIHYPKPKVVCVTQATELGTVYTPEELLQIHEKAKAHSLKVQMDGARFANAVAHLNVAPREITVDVGVDVLSFGGSKNGLGIGEAIIFFDLEAAHEFAYRCKQAGQLASKMRFIAAQWLGVLKTNAWLDYARHANDCAAFLEKQIMDIPEIEIMFPRQANSVFVRMPQAVIDAQHDKGWKFYTFIGAGGARLMCSWDTTQETIKRFISDLKACICECR